MGTVAIPTANTIMTPQELQEVAAGYFSSLASSCIAHVIGSQMILPLTKHNSVTVDLYGDVLMNLPGHVHVQHDAMLWHVQHDAIEDA